MVSVPFVGPSYSLRSSSLSADRTINLYPEVVEIAGRERVAALYGTPGLKPFATLPNTGLPVRGILTTASGRVFAVNGASLVEISALGVVTTLGTLVTSSGAVSLADNGVQLCVVDGTAGYILTLSTNAFARITDADFSPASRVAFVDGYFVFNRVGTGQFACSGLYDGATVDSLDFATAEGFADQVVSLLADHREVWLFGTQSTEVWYNAGTADFPFARIQGAFIEHGCAAAHSVAKLDNTVYWLGQDQNGDRMVYRALGYQPNRVSTHAVEYALSRYSTVSDAVGYTYQQEGHSFYVLCFPTAGATWAFDVATGMWHERASLDGLGQLTAHRVQCHTSGHGKHLVGDGTGGYVYEYDLNTYTDNGTAIPRIRQAQTVSSQRQWVRHASLELEMETGVGLDGGVTPGTDPQVALTWSDDDGATWSNEHWASAGAQGQRQTRVLWRRLGRSRDRIYRVACSEPVKIAITGASLEVA